MKNQTKEFAERRRNEVKLLNAVERLSTRSSVLNAFMNKDVKKQQYKSAKKEYMKVLTEIKVLCKTITDAIDKQEKIALKRQTRERLKEANDKAFAPKEDEEDETR